MLTAPPSHRRMPLIFRRLTVGILSALPIIAGTVAIVSLIVGFTHYRFGSIEAAQCYVRGDHILVDSPDQFRKIDPNTGEVRLEYKLTNLESSPVTLIGSNNSCSCTMLA